MFVRRRTLAGRTTYDKNFIIALKNKLIEAKLDKITVKVPHNYLKEKEESEIGIDEFIDRGRNYNSIIIRAINDQKEEIKILFVNISSKSYFYDHTFPSGHSEPSEILVSTTDPVRTWGLFEYFYNYLKNSGKKSGDYFKVIGFFLSITMLIAEFASFVSTSKLFLNSRYGYSAAFDIGAIMISAMLMYSYYNTEKGVYIKKREKSPGHFIVMILRGEFRDNPMFNFIISIIASIIASLLLGYSGCGI